MTVIFDTNVWISAAWSPRTFCRALLRFCRKRVRCVSSELLLDEFEDKLQTKLHWSAVNAAQGRRIARKLCASFLPATLGEAVCRDADDDIVLATAVAAKCEYIVTGDEDLLMLNEFRGIKIIRPGDFATIIGMPRR